MILYLVLGLALLIAGGELLVRGASGLAERFGISQLVIGITIVGFGTSAPELVTCIEAALVGAPDIAVGNVVGSNIANILLVLGAAALLYPIRCRRRELKRDGSLVVATALMLTVAAVAGSLSRPAGAIFVLGLIGYLWLLFVRERVKYKRDGSAAVAAASSGSSILLMLLLTLAGIAGLLFGGKMLIEGAVTAAERFGVSQSVIGLTLVALGTSLPEVVTAVMAALKRRADIALGNVLGSNVYNILGIAGLTAVVAPLPIDPHLLRVDLPIMVGTSVVMVVLAALMRGIPRWVGATYLASYVAYVVFLLR